MRGITNTTNTMNNIITFNRQSKEISSEALSIAGLLIDLEIGPDELFAAIAMMVEIRSELEED